MICARNDDSREWFSPTDDQLQEMYDAVHENVHHDDSMLVGLNAFTDQNDICCVCLSTINMPVFNTFRQLIRDYVGLDGYIWETFSKMAFMKPNAATIYVAKRNRRYIHRRLFREIFRNSPRLLCDYIYMYKHTFNEDLPGKPKRKGDSIIVIGGEDFMDKLSRFPEGQSFYVNDDWSPMIRGGN